LCEKLKGDRAGCYSIRINDQWRITFRIVNNRALPMEVDAGRVSRLVNAQVSVTGDTAIRLAEAFGTSAEFWIRLQGDYELARARAARVA
jgi:addiction module HigA family antidote